MTTVKIQSGTETFSAYEGKTTYTMAANRIIQGADYGIDVLGDATRRILDIDGSIAANQSAVRVGMGGEPAAPVKLAIGDSGVLFGETNGVLSFGHGHRIANAGEVSSSRTGIMVYGSAAITNTGLIQGEEEGIALAQGIGQSIIKNNGRILGGDYSIKASDAVEKIINTGKLEGSVHLGGGDDIFLFKGGSVDGTVQGNMGDDTFVVRKAGLQISEEFGEGIDSVYTSVSFELSSNIEALHLTGRKDIDAVGGSGGNEIHGNTGRNAIDGAGGMDFIDGGKGNDILTGGSSSDDFHFARGTGKDVVTDFEAGFDEILLGDLKGATDYADMLENHVRQKGDDLWITYGDDVIVLKGTLEADLKASDFDFG